jgi:hypothetical protein
LLISNSGKQERISICIGKKDRYWKIGKKSNQ